MNISQKNQHGLKYRIYLAYEDTENGYEMGTHHVEQLDNK